MHNDLKIAAQLSTVLSMPQDLEPAQVFRKVGAIVEEVPIDILAVGWAERPDLFRQLTARDTRLTGDVYLWYPFLSDYPGFDASHLVVNGNAQKSLGWGGYGGTGIQETFKQACPNNPHAIRTSLKTMEYLLSTYDFDGVFIDKIRFPSMANGLQDVFSCFCEYCMDAAARADLDLNRVRASFLERCREEQPARPSSIPPGSAWLEILISDQPLLQQFIRFRANSINNVIEQITERVHQFGKKLSLDVFSPSLAPLVGQDFIFMDQRAAWVKPMIYRFANGPASLRSEIPALIRELAVYFDWEIGRVMDWVGEKVEGFGGVSLSEIENAAPLSILRAETSNAVRLFSNSPVYLGVETLSIPGGMTIKPHNVEEILEVGQAAGVQGYVLSWDLLHTPLENVLPLRALI